MLVKTSQELPSTDYVVTRNTNYLVLRSNKETKFTVFRVRKSESDDEEGNAMDCE